MSRVLKLDVVDGGILGAVVACDECGGSGELHRPYQTPDGHRIDVHRGTLTGLGLETPEDTASEDPLMLAWGVIANAYQGDWDRATPEWRYAAERFRDVLHEVLRKDAG